MKTESEGLPIAPICIRNKSSGMPDIADVPDVDIPGSSARGSGAGARKTSPYTLSRVFLMSLNLMPRKGLKEATMVGCCLTTTLQKMRSGQLPWDARTISSAETMNRPRLYLNPVISSMPYFEKASEDELRVLLPHKWKEFHPEAILITSLRQFAK